METGIRLTFSELSVQRSSNGILIIHEYACNAYGYNSGAQTEKGKNMNRKFFAVVISAAAGCTLAAAEGKALNGAGASFPAPVYQKWTYTYTQANPDNSVNYQSIGSGAGVNQLKEGTVDFAGSDNPLTLADQEAQGLQQFPMLTGGVVIIYNIPGVGNNQLKLSKKVLSDIFLGKITRWNDPAIAGLNPELKLPRTKITVVRRADSSGTTSIFTDYLSKISEEWAANVGSGASVKWPVGMGGQKNPGVCNNVAKIRGSIGYTEYTYAVEAKLAMAVLENADGRYVQASMETFSSSAACAEWEKADGFRMMLTNMPGEKSWPITGVTYILFRKDADAALKESLKNYVTWCFGAGASFARELHYVPLPKNVVDMVTEKVFK